MARTFYKSHRLNSEHFEESLQMAQPGHPDRDQHWPSLGPARPAAEQTHRACAIWHACMHACMHTLQMCARGYLKCRGSTWSSLMKKHWREGHKHSGREGWFLLVSCVMPDFVLAPPLAWGRV